MDIEISQGSTWPVDPRFIPIAGLDASTGKPRALPLGSNGLLVETAGIGAPSDTVANNNTGAHSMIALTKRLLGKYEAGQQTMDASLPVTLASDQIVTTRTRYIRAQGSFTRPANSTAYSTGDAITDSTAFPETVFITDVSAIAGGTGTIRSARFMTNSTAAANIPFRLWLFSDPITPTPDNQPFPLLFANEQVLLGYIDFTPVTGGTGSNCVYALASNLNLPYRTAPDSRDIAVALVVQSAFTPSPEMVFTIELNVIPD